MKAEIYNILLAVAARNMTPEQAQAKIVELLSDEAIEKEFPNSYTGERLHKCPLGLYEIFWDSGGSSLAAIGNLHDGVRWIAPINWTGKDDPTGRMDKFAPSITKMVLLYTNPDRD